MTKLRTRAKKAKTVKLRNKRTGKKKVLKRNATPKMRKNRYGSYA